MTATLRQFSAWAKAECAEKTATSQRIVVQEVGRLLRRRKEARR